MAIACAALPACYGERLKTGGSYYDLDDPRAGRARLMEAWWRRNAVGMLAARVGGRLAMPDRVRRGLGLRSADR